jgi:hypothetical protein
VLVYAEAVTGGAMESYICTYHNNRHNYKPFTTLYTIKTPIIPGGAMEDRSDTLPLYYVLSYCIYYIYYAMYYIHTHSLSLSLSLSLSHTLSISLPLTWGCNGGQVRYLYYTHTHTHTHIHIHIPGGAIDERSDTLPLYHNNRHNYNAYTQ